jgi:hypothetical protein
MFVRLYNGSQFYFLPITSSPQLEVWEVGYGLKQQGFHMRKMKINRTWIWLGNNDITCEES